MPVLSRPEFGKQKKKIIYIYFNFFKVIQTLLKPSKDQLLH